MQKNDLRKNQRMPAYLGAKIFFSHKPSTFDCLVKNISEEGAQINIESVWNIPESFRLHIAKHNKSYECQTEWKTEWKTHNKLGVCYNSRF